MPGPRYFAVVPAAGSGRRFNSSQPKQYAKLNGRCVIDHALNALLQQPLITTVIVALAPGDEYWCTTDASRHPSVQTVAGGRERHHSVLNGLSALVDVAAAEDWVVVHDAARPCLKTSDLARLIETLCDHAYGGLLAVPVPDTLKRAQPGQSTVAETIDRRHLWQAQTPQLFRYKLLYQALQEHAPVTDEAQAMERAGYPPQLVIGSQANVKITSPEDLRLAEAILRVE